MRVGQRPLAQRLLVILVAVATLALGACGGPSDRAAYRETTSGAVAGAISSVGTVELAVRQWLDGRLPGAAARVVVGDAETSLAGDDTDLRMVDPPAHSSDPVRSRVVPLLGEAREAVAQARIALGRNDKGSAAQAVQSMDDVLDRLEQAAVRLR